MLYFLFFQLENESTRLLDYGVLGVVLLFIGYFAYKMYNKINEDQKIWREEAIKSRDDLIQLTIKQNELNSRLIEIRKQDVDDQRTNFYSLQKKLDNIPENVRKELSVDLFEARCDTKTKYTPARS